MHFDRNLQLTMYTNLAFDLNAQALRLAMFVEWYRQRGERTLPVQYLKRLAFTRRQWELATKGTRQYDGRKLVPDQGPAKDGCEALGIVSEYREVDPKSQKPRTYWVIGEIDQEAIAEIRRQREAADFDVVEDPRPALAQDGEAVEPSVKPGTQVEGEAEYDRGYREGEAAGYQKGFDDAGCVKDAPLDQCSREAAKTHPGKVLIEELHLNKILLGYARMSRELSETDERRRFDAEFDAGFARANRRGR